MKLKKMDTEEIALTRIDYEDIFGDETKQKPIAAVFKKILKVRKQLLDELLNQDQDPSTPSVLETRRYLLDCIDIVSSGN